MRIVENVRFRLALLLKQHFPELQRYGYEPVGRLRLERAFPGYGVREDYIPLHMHLIFFPVEVTPFESQRLSAPQTKVYSTPRSRPSGCFLIVFNIVHFNAFEKVMNLAEQRLQDVYLDR